MNVRAASVSRGPCSVCFAAGSVVGRGIVRVVADVGIGAAPVAGCETAHMDFRSISSSTTRSILRNVWDKRRGQRRQPQGSRGRNGRLFK